MLPGGQDDGNSRGFKPYWDPALRHNPRNYRKFIKRLCDIKYLEFTLEPSNHAGVFFVWKSDKKKIRMIVDARPANSVFADPPGVSLSTAETFAKIEVEGGAPYDFDFGLFAGLSDVKDCFHRIKQPRWLAKHFCFMPIEARHVGLTGHVLDGKRLRSGDLVYPMPGSLCMGFTWSLYFAQRINESIMCQVPSLVGSELIHDRGGPAVFSAADPSRLKHFVYVDNLGVLAGNRDLVAGGLADLSTDFTDRKLLLHPGEVQHEHIKALGVVLDGVNLLSKLSPDRFHRVRQAVRCVLRRNRCTGRTLEIIVGHCTYCGLCNRCVLSVFHNVYKFIKSAYTTSHILWPSVASELRAFAGLMPLLRSEWRRPWSSVVNVSDASEEGFGVCSSIWSPETVGEVGRVHERERFRRSGSHNARESALTSAGFVKNEATGKWRAGLVEDEDYLASSGWALNDSFPEVPKDCLDSGSWTTVRQGAWKRHEHIVHLEARALVKSFEHVVHDCGLSDCRQLFLVDSMSAALAFDRCRSKNFRMLRQIRKFCSFSLARNIAFSVRWLPSELNPADAPSRATASQRVNPDIFSPAPLRVSSHAATSNNDFGAAQLSQQCLEAQTQEDQSFGAKHGPCGANQEAKTRPFSEFAFQPTTSGAAHFCFSNAGQIGRHGETSHFQKSKNEFRQQRQQLQQPELLSKEEEVRQNFGSPQQTQVAEICGRSHGSLSPRPQPVGKESHRGQIAEILPARIPTPPGLCHVHEEAFDHRFSGGPNCDRVLQPLVFPRASWTPGRQNFGFFGAPQDQTSTGMAAAAFHMPGVP